MPSRAPAKRRSLALRAARTALVLGAVAIALRALGCAEAAFYAPSRRPFTTPPGVEDIWVQTDDGVRLHAWFLPARGSDPAEPGPAILHVHGNAGNISVHDSFSRFLTDAGFHVLLFDYRSYGRSDERAPLRRAALLRDTRAALTALLQRPDVDPARVGVYGVSLGGAFALHAAANEPAVRAVATLAAFSSWQGVASDHVPLLPGILLPSGVEPRTAAARLGDRPYLVVHGMRDAIVHPRHATILRDAARQAGVDATLWTDPDGDHNSLIQTSPEARAAIAAFFTDHLAAQPEPGPGPPG